MLTQWRDSDHEVSLSLVRWLYKEPINHQFIVHPRSVWLVWNYLKRVGLRSVFLKIKSRLAEEKRNCRMSGIGIGQLINFPSDSLQASGKFVLFFVPNHNTESNYLIVDDNFVIDLPSICEFSDYPILDLPESLRKMVGWTRYSGIPADFSDVKDSLKLIAKNISANVSESAITTPNFVDKVEVFLPRSSKPTAVLFGLGNYAKTVILPSIRNNLQLCRVHEIDPYQLEFLKHNHTLCLDTSPVPRDGLIFDAWFIAGYHHTHVDLAVHAFRQGATAVIEKPLATTRKQYADFISALKQYPHHRFYLCFHKRYSALHSFFESDLGENNGDPIDMHCIVYEIPLPKYHWYNWPNSGSRLISNGCHWIDYFFFVNDYCEATEYKKWMPRGSDVVVQIKLNNGAYFSMSLTDSGSQRLGVRDYIELRVRDCTFTMVDSERYVAENRTRIFRKKHVNPLNAYHRMYKKLSRDICLGAGGDSLKSLISSDAALILEDL